MRRAYSVIACHSLVRINSRFIYGLNDQDQQDLENLLFCSLGVNSPSFLGAAITRKTRRSTGKTQRKHKGILLVPDPRTVCRRAGPPLSAPHNSCERLHEGETKPPLATDGAMSLLCGAAAAASSSQCHPAVLSPPAQEPAKPRSSTPRLRLPRRLLQGAQACAP